MTTPRDPDQLIAAWLDEHAVPLPTSTQRAIDVAVRTTPQQRRLTWLPRRSATMNLFLRAAAAVAVLAIGLGTVAVLQRSPGTGGPPTAPPASPSPSASALPEPSTWLTFTSERYGYEIRYPDGWDTYQASGRYMPGEDIDDQEVSDRITVGTSFSGVYGASTPLEAGVEPEAWIEQNVCPCDAPVTDWETSTIDGQPARYLENSSEVPTIELYVFTDERVYRFIGANLLVRDEPLWEAFLSTIRLHPEDAATP